MANSAHATPNRAERINRDKALVVLAKIGLGHVMSRTLMTHGTPIGLAWAGCHVRLDRAGAVIVGPPDRVDDALRRIGIETIDCVDVASF